MKKVFILLLLVIGASLMLFLTFAEASEEPVSSSGRVSVFAEVVEQISFSQDLNSILISTNYERGLFIFGDNVEYASSTPIQKTIPMEDSFILVANY